MRIGYVDYKLENYHANVFLKLFREQLKGIACGGERLFWTGPGHCPGVEREE